MSKSTTTAPRLSLEQAQSSTSSSSSNSKKQTKTSRARAVRSNATSWTQDDEDDDDYEFVEKPSSSSAKNTDGSAEKASKWLKKAVKKVAPVRKPLSERRPYANLGSYKNKKEQSNEQAYLEEPVDVEAEFLKDRQGMDVRYGGLKPEEAARDPFGDEDEAESDEDKKSRPVGSAGRGFRD